MDKTKLVQLAESAGFSPTFINWFEEKPEEVLKVLYSFWKMKPQILDYLDEYTPNDFYIKIKELPKEGLFE